MIEGVTSDASPILMPLEDGSVVVGGQQESGGGYLARINALGETMFAVSIDDPPDRMAVTPSGFVLHMMQLNRLYDFDEDGNLLGIREVEYERDPYMEVLEDMANLGGETALLMDAESVGGSRAEIVFAPGEGISVPDDEYSHALYHESGCALQDVWPQESGVLALIERSDGQRVGLSIDADGGVQEVEAPEPRKRNRQAVSRRHAVVERGAGRRGGDAGRWAGPRNLACAHDDPYRGRQARMALRTGTAGRELCPRRTIPHRGRRGAGTGGYDGGHWAGRRAARDCPDSVRRGRYAVGCVRDMVYDPQRGLLLLTARGGQTKNGVCDIQTADGSFDVYVHVGFEAEDARLTLDDSGYAYVCGTDRDNGQNITAVVRVDLDAGEAPVKR